MKHLKGQDGVLWEYNVLTAYRRFVVPNSKLTSLEDGRDDFFRPLLRHTYTQKHQWSVKTRWWKPKADQMYPGNRERHDLTQEMLNDVETRCRMLLY